MNNTGIEKSVFEQLIHGVYKYLLETAIIVPALKGAKYAGVVDFWYARFIFINGDLLPLTPRVHQFQNIVEETKIRQFCTRAS
jgi:hypothetical protein